MKPRVEFSGVLVLAPISHIALTLAAEKPSSLHSNTTRLSSIRRFSEGMTSSAYVLSSAFCINSSRKWVFLLYKSLDSLWEEGEEGRQGEDRKKKKKVHRSRARSSLSRRALTAKEGVEWSSSKPCCSRILRMSVEAPLAGTDMMEASSRRE